MTNVMHTKGPWVSCPHASRAPELVRGADNMPVCWVMKPTSEDEAGQEEWLANIRLITAAPKLLGAIQTALYLMEVTAYKGPGFLEAREAVADALSRQKR